MDENFHNYGNFSNLILRKYLKISIEILTQNIDELKIDKKKSYKSNKKTFKNKIKSIINILILF